MKFKGKVDLWMWLVLILGDALMLYPVFTAKGIGIILGISLVIYNLSFLPFMLRNYVIVTDDKIILVFGFIKQTMDIDDLYEVYRTNNPISSTAASLDRIVLKGFRQSILCAVTKREEFFKLLKEKNPHITINENKKFIVGNSISKFTGIFILVVFAFIGAFLFTGDIKTEYNEDYFVVVNSYYPDKKIEYKDIDGIEYVQGSIDGTRVGGFGSFRLLMGNFKNSAYGNYLRYTYTDSDAAVVLEVDGKKIVIGGKDEETTYQIYTELLSRCNI